MTFNVFLLFFCVFYCLFLFYIMAAWLKTTEPTIIVKYYVWLQYRPSPAFLAKLPSWKLWWQFQSLFFIWSAFGNFFSPLKTLVAHRKHRLKLLSQHIMSWSPSGRLGAVAANALDKFLAVRILMISLYFSLDHFPVFFFFFFFLLFLFL